MKMKHWMFAVLSICLLAETILAQAPPVISQDTPPPVIPAEAVPATPRRPAPKKATPAPKVKNTETTAPAAQVSAGPAVAKERNVNVRGQAAINSEIVTHLKRGDVVTVIEEVTLKKVKTDEPGRWAKIALPAGTAVWVHGHFIDKTAKTVIPKRLNVRSGPGENYSILGRIERGTVVKDIETKGVWIKIEAPENSYAFVAAHLLSTDPADLGPALAKLNPPAPPVAPPVQPPIEVAVVTPEPIAPPADPFITPPATVITPPPPPTETAVTPAPITPPPPEEEVLIKRIVTREGIIKGSASIQAPTYFVLRSLDNNKTINYLHSPTADFSLKGFQLQRVIVTGEEVLDERWPNTPVVNIESIEAVPQ